MDSRESNIKSMKIQRLALDSFHADKKHNPTNPFLHYIHVHKTTIPHHHNALANSINAKHHPLINATQTATPAHHGNTQNQYRHLIPFTMIYAAPPNTYPALSATLLETSQTVTRGRRASPTSRTEMA